MNNTTLIHSSIIAALVVAAVIGVSMVTGFPSPEQNAAGDLKSIADTAGSPAAAPYISIDPVPGKTTGDLLIVTGSTNLPAGTTLMIQTGNYGGNTIVVAGTGGTNRFSTPIDTSALKPGLQTITVTMMKGDPGKGDYGMGSLNTSTAFTVKGSYRGSDIPVTPTITEDDYIRLDAIGDHSTGDKFLITGTTSLPAGTSIFWQVIPQSEQPMTSGRSTMPDKGIMANNAVTKGDGTINRISLAVDMTDFPKGEYIVVAAVMKGEISSGNVGVGDLAGSASFTLK